MSQKEARDFLVSPDITEPLGGMAEQAWFVGRGMLYAVLIGYALYQAYQIVEYVRASYPKIPIYIAIGIALAVVMITILMIFTVVLIIGAIFAPISIFGVEIVNFTPNTCPPTHPDRNGLLCYTNCPPGYHGVGPVCWADTYDRGIGTPVGLEPCPDGWINDGLICRNPIRCDPIDTHGSPWPWNWTGGGCRGGELKGRLDGGGVCPGPVDAGGLDRFDGWYKEWKNASQKKDPTGQYCKDCDRTKVGEKTKAEVAITHNKHSDKKDGLCYKPCPSGMTSVPGMPYLCMKEGIELSRPRDAGRVPSLVRLFGVWNPF